MSWDWKNFDKLKFTNWIIPTWNQLASYLLEQNYEWYELLITFIRFINIFPIIILYLTVSIVSFAYVTSESITDLYSFLLVFFICHPKAFPVLHHICQYCSTKKSKVLATWWILNTDLEFLYMCYKVYMALILILLAI